MGIVVNSAVREEVPPGIVSLHPDDLDPSWQFLFAIKPTENTICYLSLYGVDDDLEYYHWLSMDGMMLMELYTSRTEALEAAMGAGFITYAFREHDEVLQTAERLAESDSISAGFLFYCGITVIGGFFGRDSTEYADACMQFGNYYLCVARPTSARELFQTALEIYERKFGPGHPQVIRCRRFLTQL